MICLQLAVTSRHYMHALTQLRWTGGQAVPPGYNARPKLVARAVSHDNVAESIDMSDVDRHRFSNYAAGLEPASAACSRIRRVVLRRYFCRVAPIRTLPVRRVRSVPGGLVGTEKCWRNLVWVLCLCKCLASSVHILLTLQICVA